MTEQQKVYFDLKYKNRLDAVTKWHGISEKKPDLKVVKQGYPVTINFIRNTLKNEYEDSKKSFEDEYIEYIKHYVQYYSDERAQFFLDLDKVIEWFEKQNNSCGYCGITHDELQKIVEKRGGNLTLNNKKKRSKGTLEIERLKPATKDDVDFGYNYDNCILACPLCNNAKSNLIEEDAWKKIFVPAMKQYYKQLLDDVGKINGI